MARGGKKGEDSDLESLIATSTFSDRLNSNLLAADLAHTALLSP